MSDPMILEQALESLRLKFTSGNSIPVERASVTRAEYEAIHEWLAKIKARDAQPLAQPENAMAVLGYIRDAKRFDRKQFADDSAFADWAQSWARHATQVEPLTQRTAQPLGVPAEVRSAISTIASVASVAKHRPAPFITDAIKTIAGWLDGQPTQPVSVPDISALQRYFPSLPVRSPGWKMLPDPKGEWVLFSDVQAMFADPQSTAQPASVSDEWVLVPDDAEAVGACLGDDAAAVLQDALYDADKLVQNQPASTGEGPCCPQCGRTLTRVRKGENSTLNDDQFDAIRAGDWYCDTCPNNGRGVSGLAYFWDREVEKDHE